jgi:hypothetical protein
MLLMDMRTGPAMQWGLPEALRDNALDSRDEVPIGRQLSGSPPENVRKLEGRRTRGQ